MNSKTNAVVLLHGLGRSPASMLPMALRLGRAGFTVQRLGYPSTRMRVEPAIAYVREKLQGVLQSKAPVDLVGHSLGGLIAAAILRDPGSLEIGRVVQLGAPNLGSPLAARLGHTWPLRRICGPALGDLASHDHHIPPSDRIGAIAGTAGLPEASLSGPNDGAVTVRSAWCGAGHQAAIPVLHTWLPASGRVCDLVAAFLRFGRFPEEKR